MQELSKIFQSALQSDLIGILSSDFLFNKEKKNMTEKLEQYYWKLIVLKTYDKDKGVLGKSITYICIWKIYKFDVEEFEFSFFSSIHL